MSNVSKEVQFDQDALSSQIESEILKDKKENGNTAKNGGFSGFTKVDEDAKKSLRDSARKSFEGIGNFDPKSEEFKKIAETISNVGVDAINAISKSTSSIIKAKSLNDMKSNGTGMGDKLSSLRGVIVDLTPDRKPNTLFEKMVSVMSLKRVRTKLTQRFKDMQSAESFIDDIRKSLDDSCDQILKENAELEYERDNLLVVMESCEHFNFFLEEFKELVKKKMEEYSDDPVMLRAIENQLYHPTLRRIKALTKNIAISMAGYINFDNIISSNKDLVFNVKEAKDNSLNALRIAIIVDQSLSNQKREIEKVNGLNDTVSDLIKLNAETAYNQSKEIVKMNEQAGIKTEAIMEAIEKAVNTIDLVHSSRKKANEALERDIGLMKAKIEDTKNKTEKVMQVKIIENLGVTPDIDNDEKFNKDGAAKIKGINA